MEIHSFDLGPADIKTLSESVDALLPWLGHAQFRVLPNGNLEFDDPNAAEAVRVLRESVELILPEDIRRTLGKRSGLGWKIFFGHVVTWWLPQRRRLGFLRALENRSELHQVPLRLLWNRERIIPVLRKPYGNETLIWGGIAGVLAGLIITKAWPGDPILALIAMGFGLVLGRVWQRVSMQRICGDALCRAPVGRKKSCPHCGGIVTDPHK